MPENVSFRSNGYITIVISSLFQFLSFYLLFSTTVADWGTKTLRDMRFVHEDHKGIGMQRLERRKEQLVQRLKMQMSLGTERAK